MSYPSDLKDAQWELIKGHFDVGNYGNRGVHEKRHLINAVFYLVKTGPVAPVAEGFSALEYSS